MNSIHKIVVAVVIFAGISCHKDNPLPATPTLGTWTIQGRTYNALSIYKTESTVVWFDVIDGYTDTTSTVNAIGIGFTNGLPNAPGSFQMGYRYNDTVSTLPPAAFVQASLKGNTMDEKLYGIPIIAADISGTGTVELINGKRYVSSNRVRVYQISPEEDISDSTNLSFSKLEY
jgi:hypothetical protein